MKRLLYGVLLLFLFGAFHARADGTLSPLPFTHITSPSAPPSYPIAIPLAGGPLRVFFFGQREMTGFSWSEITARLECVSESVLTESRGDLSPAKMPAAPDSILLSPRGVSDRASELLGRFWDVIWLDFDFHGLPKPVREKLLERVEQGSGLVYVGKAAGLGHIARSGSFDRARLRGVTYPEGSVEYAGMLGKGIILAIPEFNRGSRSQETGDYFTGAVNALLLASGRFSAFGVTGIQDKGKDIEHESMNIMNYRVNFHNGGAGALRTVHVRYRDENGKVVHESEDSYDMRRGTGFFRVTYPMLPLGGYSADISILEGGNVVALAGEFFRVRSEDMLEAITLRNELALPGEFLSGRVRMSREMEEGMVLVVELFDHLGRLVDRNELIPESNRKWEDFAFKATEDMSGMMDLQASLYKNNKRIHTLSTPVFVRTSEQNRRFSLIVGGKAIDEPWLTPGYARLVKAGVKAFSLDMKGMTPSDAFRAAREVLRAGGTPIPVFSPEAGPDEGNGGAGTIRVEMLAVADTLLKLPIPECWIKPAGDNCGSGADSARYRSLSLSEFPEAVKNGDVGKQVRPGPSPEAFFGRGNEYVLSELRIAPWRNLFRGIDTICWEGVSGKAGDALIPGGGINPSFSILAGECRSIMEGIDLLLSGAQWEDGSAVLSGPDHPGAKAAPFRDGRIRYIGILPDPKRDADSTGIPATVRMADSTVPAHVYDVREGAYRGQPDEISFSLKNGRAELFALLPYRVKDIDVRFSGGVVRSGGKLDFEAGIVPQETGMIPGRHVLSIRFYGPDGIERFRLRSDCEAPQGKIHVSFLIPSVEPQGKWTLTVRDVASGKETERPFIIMPPVN